MRKLSNVRAKGVSGVIIFTFLVLQLSISVLADSPFPLEDTFKLHSNPGALHAIYLDFDGHITKNTAWNYSIDEIVTPPYSIDEDSSNFSEVELLNI